MCVYVCIYIYIYIYIMYVLGLPQFELRAARALGGGAAEKLWGEACGDYIVQKQRASSYKTFCIMKILAREIPYGQFS